MKITRTETTILRIPEDDPLADMPEEAGRLRPIVTCASRPTPARGHRHHASTAARSPARCAPRSMNCARC